MTPKQSTSHEVGRQDSAASEETLEREFRVFTQDAAARMRLPCREGRQPLSGPRCHSAIDRDIRDRGHGARR